MKLIHSLILAIGFAHQVTALEEQPTLITTTQSEKAPFNNQSKVYNIDTNIG